MIFFFKSIFHPRSVGSPTEDRMTTGEHQSHRKTYSTSILRSEQETQEARTKSYSASGSTAARHASRVPAGVTQFMMLVYIWKKKKKNKKTRQENKKTMRPLPPPMLAADAQGKPGVQSISSGSLPQGDLSVYLFCLFSCWIRIWALNDHIFKMDDSKRGSLPIMYPSTTPCSCRGNYITENFMVPIS